MLEAVACVVAPEASQYGDYDGRAAKSVCNALERRGVSIGPVVARATGYRAAYVVHVRPLGSKWTLSVVYEEPVGVEQKTRWMYMSDPNDVADIADDMALALTKPDPEVKKEVEHKLAFGALFDGWFGFASEAVAGSSTGVFTIGATALVQYEWLEAGVAWTDMGALFTESTSIYGGLAGVRFDPFSWTRVDLLLEAGAERVTLPSAYFFTTVSAGTATVPYLGGRASFSLLLGRTHRMFIGWWLNAGASTENQTLPATVETCLLQCTKFDVHYTIGGASLATGPRIGGYIH